MINAICARGERYVARLLTTSPKFTLDGEGIAVCAAKEREGRFDRISFKRRIPATCKLSAKERGGGDAGESWWVSRDSVLTRAKTQPGERFQMNFV